MANKKPSWNFKPSMDEEASTVTRSKRSESAGRNITIEQKRKSSRCWAFFQQSSC